MARMKVVVRILCAVALLVQCATCGKTSARLTPQDVVKVMTVLHSYRDPERYDKLNKELTTVESHYYMLRAYRTFELDYPSVASHPNGVYRSPLDETTIDYCPTATMLACGQADVPDQVCLELLRRANVLVKTYNQRKSWMATDEVDSDKEPSSPTVTPQSRKSVRTLFSKPEDTTRYATAAQETGWQPSTMPNTKPVVSSRQRGTSTIERGDTTRYVTATQETGWQPPVASSRERSAASIERGEKLTADVQELLKKRPTAEELADIWVEERRMVLEIKIIDWDAKEYMAKHKLEELREQAPELKTKQKKLEKQQDELTKEQDELTKEQDELTKKLEELTMKQEELTMKQEELTMKQEELTKKHSYLKSDEASLAKSQQPELDALKKIVEERVKFVKERDSLQEQGDARMKLLQNEAQSRNTQIKRSVQTMRMLAHFPYKFQGNEEDEERSKKWINEMSKETKHLRDVAKECYPEQFIVCGRHARSLADDKKRAVAVSQCIDTIRKYNGFRRMARDVFTNL